MFTIKILLSHSLKPPINSYSFLKSTNHVLPPTILKASLNSFTSQTHHTILSQQETSSTSQPQNPTQNTNNKNKNKKPLDIIFKEALGVCERSEIKSEEKGDNDEEQMKNKLWELELELRQLKGTKRTEVGPKCSKTKSLVSMFIDKGVERETENLCRKQEEVVLKEISKDMEMLLRHLYVKGYFKDVNFLPRNEFDVGYFDGVYARDFLKFAVEKFGEDYQDITPWLSGSDLKTLAQFGCPSLKKREIFAAKRLRNIFEIPEETVCSKCSLKGSCKFVNQSVWGGDNKNLRLSLLMRLLRTYSLEDIPPQLKLTEELKTCVSRLMHEIINLSKSSSRV